MSEFRVGVVEQPVNVLHAPTAVVDSTYLIAAASGGFVLGAHHLNQFFRARLPHRTTWAPLD